MPVTLLDKTRHPVSQLLALNEDGSTLMDLSPYLISYDLTFTDELKAHQASLTLASPGGFFDKYGNAGGANVLLENRILQLKKGFADLTTGTQTLYPAFVGRITHALGGYQRDQAETIQVDAFDLMKPMLKQKITTDPYYNTQANLIAADILSRYGDKYARLLGTNLAALSYSFPFVQWPDYLLTDILAEIFEPSLYFVWFGYDGRLTSSPRLGAGGSPLLGFPDATSAPTPDFTLPDAGLIHSLTPEWQDYEFTNQVRVLGQALAESVTLGPTQVLTATGDPINSNFIAPRAGITKRLYFSQQQGNNNAVTAQNVYLKIYDPSFSAHDNTPYGGTNGGLYRYLASGVGIVNDIGNTVPYPTYDQSFPPGHQNVVSQKSSGKTEGGIALAVATSTFVDIQVFANSDGGGFIWAVEVHGQPVLTSQQTLTAILDLAPIAVTESLTDTFGDHQTYQGSKAPWAMGTPVVLAVNPSSLASTTLTASASAGQTTITVASTTNMTATGTLVVGTGATTEYPQVQSVAGSVVTLTQPLTFAHVSGTAVVGVTGVNSADGVYQNTAFQVDFERGRVVLQNRLFLPFTADSLFTGGSTGSTATVYNTTFETNPAPQAVYQSYRQTGANSAFSYALTGLQVGRGYTVRLHLADPTSTGSGQRVFDVLGNGAVLAQGVDIYQIAGGAGKACVQEITGVVPDGSGNLVLSFQNGSVAGSVSPGTGSPLVCGIEVVLPQGTGGIAFAINCGGAAINPTAPTVSLAYAYSSNQQIYGIANQEINDPLLGTLAQCQNVGQYALNRASWARSPVAIRAASLPTLTTGQVLKFFHPWLGVSGADCFMYVQGVRRHQERPDTSGDFEADYDDYTGYLLYRAFR